MASKLYGVDATIIIFVFVLYCKLYENEKTYSIFTIYATELKNIYKN